MSHSVTNITCSDCNEKFDGVLNDIFDVEKSYVAQCPKCNGLTIFYGVTGIIDPDIPQDAVDIKYVAKL